MKNLKIGTVLYIVGLDGFWKIMGKPTAAPIKSRCYNG